jgi:hypothetical protein
MVVGFTATCAISAYHHLQQYVINFVNDLRQGRWFSPGTPVSSINRTDRHDITEILLKEALNTIIQTNQN